MDNPSVPLPTLAGKRAVVTGANTGIGREIALNLAKAQAEVILACRSSERGLMAKQAIDQEIGTARSQVEIVDVSDRESIEDFAARVTERWDTLDILVNNAGINRTNRAETGDGLELVFATNVLGYMWVTQSLLPLLRRPQTARIINVASSFAGGLDLEDLQFEKRKYKAIAAYKQSKQSNRMLTRELARRLEGSGITVNAMTPGLVMTQLYRDAGWFQRTMLGMVSKFAGRTLSQAADTAMWLASAAEVGEASGKFFEERQEQDCQFADPHAERALWEQCEALSGHSIAPPPN